MIAVLFEACGRVELAGCFRLLTEYFAHLIPEIGSGERFRQE